MGKTIRKDRNDKIYQEGRDNYFHNGEWVSFRTYKCKCEYCRSQKRKNRYDTLDEQLIDMIDMDGEFIEIINRRFWDLF